MVAAAAAAAASEIVAVVVTVEVAVVAMEVTKAVALYFAGCLSTYIQCVSYNIKVMQSCVY